MLFTIIMPIGQVYNTAGSCHNMILACVDTHWDSQAVSYDWSTVTELCVQDGLTAVYVASYKGHDQILELLLRRKADVNLQTKVRFLYVTYLP